MPRYFHTLLFSCSLILFNGLLRAQEPVVTGVVTTSNGAFVPDAQLVNSANDPMTSTNEKGEFVLPYKVEMVFGVEKRGLETQWFKMDKAGRHYTIQLNYAYQELPEMEVSKEQISEVMDFESVNILDYMPTEEGILALVNKKGRYGLILGDGDDFSEIKNLDFRDRPQEFFRDCMGNVHVLGKESTYQLYVENGKVSFLEVLARSQFDAVLAPCIASFSENAFVMKELSGHNQRYALDLYEKGKEPKRFYECEDKVSLMIAEEDALLLELLDCQVIYKDSSQQNTLNVRRRIREITGENPDLVLSYLNTKLSSDTNGRYSPGMHSKWDLFYMTYLLHSYPINVRSFQLNQHVVAVDFESNEFTIMDQEGNKIENLPFAVNEEVNDIFQDGYSGRLYLFTESNGNSGLYQLDLASGKTIKSLSLKGLPFIETIRIYKGWVYFREIDNSFFKVRKLPMSVWENEAMNE